MQLTHRVLAVAFTATLGLVPFATAQSTLPPNPPADVIAPNLPVDLPDSPGALLANSTLLANSSSSLTGSPTGPAAPEASEPGAAAATPDPDSAEADGAQTQTTTTASRPKGAGHLQMVVNPNEIAQPMTVSDKIESGMISSVSLYSAVGWLSAAGWEHLWNSSPNYGTDSGAFGERLGAAALRGVSEGVLSNSFFAPIFHEDPRYYVMGPGHGFIKRAWYAGTRVLVTRTDSGHSTPNFSLLAGNLAGSALTIPYYPPLNTSFKEVMITFGGSIGGSALGFVVDEFIVDALIDLHIKKKQ
jgi:hypothetical protein